MDGDLARRLGITPRPSPDSYKVLALDRHQLNHSLKTESELVVGGNHIEQLSFIIIDSPQDPVILGLAMANQTQPTR